MEVSKYRSILEKAKGKKEALEELYKSKEQERISKIDEKLFIEKAITIIQEVALETQNSLKFHIEAPITSALEAVLTEPYEFKLDFAIKRGKTECSLLFARDGHTITPKDSSGGTALDLASLALRIALWSVSTDRSDNVFILDEPFKHVSPDLREKTAAFVQTLSERLGVQFILVSHDQTTMIQHADKIIHVKMKDGVSTIN